MWADFEWENKVSVNTSITNLHQFVQHIARQTNMRILTPIDALPSTVSFLAANLYARSTFGAFFCVCVCARACVLHLACPLPCAPCSHLFFPSPSPPLS